ncbi:Tyrosine-protein phosphatase 10D [Holothuria leucospilota]|uniref:protein-tyrosine-phosphatase n=1 Tax=Holothuria leucospilota TaxID=206669 RepID=A0A9Q1H3W8_HOLLE|nr:Tyrosine-protein phosphatase 10D [Holothuria leucospilota]
MLQVLLTYFKSSTGDTTTMATEATTAVGPPIEDATTTVTTEIPTTLEPTTPSPELKPPGNVNVTDVPSNNTVFTVSWDDDQDSRLTVTYNIIVNTTDGTETQTFPDVTSVYTVTGRTPGQEYSVTVVVVDRDSSREKPGDVKTITLQPNIVENLRRQNSSTTSVTAVWSPPSKGVFDSYNISCSNGTADPETIQAGEILKASCNDVMPGRLHTITVATISGSRSNSDDENIWSKPNTVQDLEGVAVTNDSVSVTWSLPYDHIDSYFYIVDCSEGTADNDNITDGKTISATCSPVTAGSLVTVTVTTYSGLESNADSTTVRAKPNSVDTLGEDSATINSVTASWLRPDGEVTQYNISCSDGNPEKSVVMDDDTSAEYNATCQNISKPGTECTVTVTSVSDTVAGDSRSIKITAYPIPPDLVEGASTETSISVEWKEPNSVVDFYIIECSNGTASPSNITATDGILTASCTGLTSPGDLYSISVQSQSNDKLSDAATESINALPENVTLVKSPSLVDTVSATWERPRGVFEQFYVQCAPTDNAVPLEDVIPYDQDASSYAANCSVFIPGDVYNMTVISRSGNQNSSASTIELRALPECLEPFAVENISTDAVKLILYMSERGQDGGCICTSIIVIVQTDGIDSYEVNATYDEITTYEENVTDGNFILVKDLTPGECYIFTCTVASYEIESSPKSIQQCTLPEAVDSFTVEEVTTTTVELQWTMKNSCKNDSCVWSSFDVSHNPYFFEKNVPQNERSTTFTSLTPGESYTFTIIVLSEDEESSPVTVVDRTEPNIVQNLTQQDSSTTSVTAVWSPPLNSVFDSYDISCSSGTAVPVTIQAGETRKASCTGVASGRLETITVTTVSGSRSNSDDLGIWSKPNIVQDLEEDVVTTNSVSVKWNQSDDHIDSYYYIVSCSEGFADNENVTDGTTTATCSPVTAGSLVTVTVTTYSGLESNADSTTVRAKPNSVDELDEDSATINSVTASWKKPDGEVMQYNVSCTECTVTVTSFSDTVAGDSRSIRITTYPIPPVLLEAASTETSISVEWQKPDSVVDYYIIECPNGTASPSNITATDGLLTASCTGLTSPGALYSISVQSQSNDKLSDAATEVINALPASVTLMKSPSLVDTVSATWARPVGEFDLFNIQCEPVLNSNPLEDVIHYIASSYGADCNVSIPGDLYTMTVVSRSGNQNSSPSTLELRALPEAVDSFTVEDVTTNMVELQWTMKNRCEDGGCVWSSFYVSHVPEFSEEIVPGNENSTIFVSLTPGESYTFRITVLSEEEESSPETVVERTIPESVDKFNVSRYSTDFVELYWTIKEICNDSGCVWDSYNLTYTPDGDPEEQQPGPPLDSADLSTSVTNLTPGENYNFSIIAVSGEKGSSPRWFIQRTKPETVEEFSVTSHLTEMVTLSWTIKAMCEDGGCVWDAYSILYTASSDTGGTPLEESRNSLATEIEINELTPGESYDFSITVISGEEESVPERVVQRTLPESVYNFTVTAYSNNHVTLSWTMTEKCENNDCVWTSFQISYNSIREDGIAKGKRSASIDSLRPGAEYTFDIIVISYNEFSTSKNTTQRLRPNNVGELRVPSDYSDQIVVEWDKPYGDVSGYDTTISGTDGYSDIKHVAIPEVTYPGLTPGEYYNVTVCTRSYKETCTEVSSKLGIRTVPALPSAPAAVSLTATSISSVELTFQEPEDPNGIIMKYIISYTGTKDGDGNEHTGDKEVEVTDPDQQEFSETFNNLWPGFTYEFRVSAENEAGEGPERTAEVALGQEEPEKITVQPDEVASSDSTGTEIRTFTLQFSSGLFSHCNGELKNYSVFVVENDGNETIGDPPRSYEEAQKQKRLPVYLATAEKTYPFPPDYSSCTSQRKKRQTPDSVEVVIGDGNCIEMSDKDYCNGELHGNREYKVMYRACNDVGCSDSPYSEIIKTELNNASWLVPLIFILVVLICALAIFVVWKERQQPGIITNHFKRPKSGIDNRGFDHDKPMRRQGDNRPVKLAEFGQFLEDMSRDSDYLFSEEYNDLRPIGKNQSTDAAQLEVNRVKNRFSNILPYDHTRVTLSPVDDEEGSDYINANYMLGYKSQREYIACQGPLQSTEEDMWRLVWEQGASIIVMVTQLMENGKIKCHQYWPDEGEGPVRYGEIVVNPMKVQKEQLWTIRKFQITKGPVTRTVTHFNFIAWPDHGVPERPDDLIKFVQAVRECKKMDGKPVVVHCSAGVGRTGTFISLDHLMSAMKEKDEVDIYGMVRSMRMNRCMMVQTESQYIFIHQCVMALLEGSVENDAVYENVNGNGYFSEALI